MNSRKGTRANKTEDTTPVSANLALPTTSSAKKQPQADMSALVAEMAAMRAEMSAVRSEVGEFRDSLEFLAGKFDVFERRLDGLETKLGRIDFLESEVSNLRSTVAVLHAQHQELEQRERRCNVEVFGLPERADEDCTELALGIARVAGVRLAPEELEGARRVGAPREERPRALLMRLRSHPLRERLLQAVRARRGVSTAELGMPAPSRRIFITEHLSPFFKDLLRRAKEIAREHAYAYVWTRNGRIRVRKVSGGPLINITSAEDLKLVI